VPKELTMSHTHRDLRREITASPSAGYFVIFLVSFAAFLAVAMAAGLAGLQWRQWFPGAEGDSSLFTGVKQAVYSFMSHLT
jgi:light-harvesting complex 1 beta chain